MRADAFHFCRHHIAAHPGNLVVEGPPAFHLLEAGQISFRSRSGPFVASDPGTHSVPETSCGGSAHSNGRQYRESWVLLETWISHSVPARTGSTGPRGLLPGRRLPLDYEVVGKSILIAATDAFKLRTVTSVTVTAPIPGPSLTSSALATTLSCKSATYLPEFVGSRPASNAGQRHKEISR